MPILQVFDPPMCCSTGVCGPDPNDALVVFSGALRWLQRHGVDVTRHNPASNPEAFMDTPAVYDVLMREGQDVLPVVLVDGTIAFKGKYPSREALAERVGLTPA
ncbi:MAG: arsenite efflux transporter metallochaperone ArsD [Rhodothermales bacterium]